MKAPVAFILLILCVSVCNSQLNDTETDTQHGDFESFIRINIVNDTILDIITDKKFIYFMKGHHGHIWSLVVPDNGCYILAAGNTPNNEYHIDTIVSENSILLWGMDTMPAHYAQMRPVYRDSYWPFYERLVVFSEKKEIIFDSENAIAFRGTDSITFNANFSRLIYFMYWSALPKHIQEGIPAPK